MSSVALALGALSACAEKPVQAPPAPRVLAAPALATTDTQTLISGTVRSLGAHDVAVEMGGRIVRLHANVGDRVRAGQILAELDSAPARLQASQVAGELSAAQAALSGAVREAERLEALVAADAASRQELDNARSAVEQAQGRVRAIGAQSAEAARRLAISIVRAPVDGVITQRRGELSSIIAPGGVLFSLDAGGGREIVASLPGALANAVDASQTVAFRFGASQGTARLAGVSPSAEGVDARAARFTIVSGSPPQGAAVELRLNGVRAEDDDVTVPLSAVLLDGTGARRVLVIDQKSRAVITPVTLLDVSSSGARVRGRISAGQSVVAAGGEFVKPGQTVRPLPYTS